MWHFAAPGTLVRVVGRIRDRPLNWARNTIGNTQQTCIPGSYIGLTTSPRQPFTLEPLPISPQYATQSNAPPVQGPGTLNEDSWEWIPPLKNSAVAVDGDLSDEHNERHIEVIPGELLTIDEILQVLRNNNGGDIECLDLEGKSNAAKFMVIATAKSYRHVHKIVREILEEHKRRGVTVARPIEQGKSPSKNNDWICVDIGHVLVNVLVAEARLDLSLEDVFVKNSSEDILVEEGTS